MSESETKSFAYLSAGELFLISPDGKERQINSHFARETEANAQANQKRHSWKNENTEFGAFDTWGASKYEHWKEHKARFVSFTQGADPDLLYYLLKLPNAIGLFRYTISSEDEYRSFHTNNINLNEISFHPEKDQIIASFLNEEQSHIGTLASNSLDFDLITDGDVYDSAPSWELSNPNTLYYQSCGIGRTQDGVYAGVSPISINRLNIESGDHETVIEDENYDYLSPKIDREGNLYYIQRPYGNSGLKMPWYEAIFSILMTPVRVIKGIVTIIDGVSKIFNQKPMAVAGPKPQNKEVNRWLTIKGTNIDLKKLKKEESNDGAVVPRAWKLIKLDQTGVEHEIANAVIEFDVSPDGNLLYSNGYKIFGISAGEKKQLFKSSSIIEQVKWLLIS